jgi:hypothetical protein
MEKDRHTEDWAKRLREWEQNPGAEPWERPAADLWDKVAADLPAPSRRRRWWWGGLLLIGVLGVAGWFFLAAEPVTNEPVASQSVPTTKELPVGQQTTAAVAARTGTELVAGAANTTNKLAEIPQENLPVSLSNNSSSNSQGKRTPPTNELAAAPPNPSVEATALRSDLPDPNRTRRKNQRPDPSPVSPLAKADEPAASGPVTVGTEALPDDNGSVTTHFDPTATTAPLGIADSANQLFSLPQAASATSSAWADIQQELPLIKGTIRSAATVAALPTPGISAPPSLAAATLGDWLAIVPPARNRGGWSVDAFLIADLQPTRHANTLTWRLQQQQSRGGGLQLNKQLGTRLSVQLGAQYHQNTYRAESRFIRLFDPTQEQNNGSTRTSTYNLTTALVSSSGSSDEEVKLDRDPARPIPLGQRLLITLNDEFKFTTYSFPIQLAAPLWQSYPFRVSAFVGGELDISYRTRVRKNIQVSTPGFTIRRLENAAPASNRIQQDNRFHIQAGARFDVSLAPHWGVHLQYLWQPAAPRLQDQLATIQTPLRLGLNYAW